MAKTSASRLSTAEDTAGLSHYPGSGKSLLSRPEVRIAVLYVLFASIWIIVSDMTLNRLSDPAKHPWLTQSSKGINFVLTTGVLLYFLLHRIYGGWRKAEQLRIENARASIQTLRLLAIRVESLREEERTRISREIHDELGQYLTGMKMQLRLIENRLSGRDDRSLNPLIEKLVEASTTIDHMMASVRRIAAGLRPLTLDHLGLFPSLDEEARRFTRNTGIGCHLKLGRSEESMPPEVATAVFRIFQELLTNIARHAKASLVDAECEVRDGCLTVRVRDDGVGMDPEALAGSASLGLAGMRERAAGVGGSFEIRALPGQGTEAVATIPLQAADPAQNRTPSSDEIPDCR